VLAGGQALATAFADVGLVQPVAQAALEEPEILGDTSRWSLPAHWQA
jgi:hypothetical protein